MPIQAVVAAAAAHVLDRRADVVLLARGNLAVVGAVVQGHGQVGRALLVGGRVDPGRTVQQVGAESAVQEVGAASSVQRVGEVAADQEVVALSGENALDVGADVVCLLEPEPVVVGVAAVVGDTVQPDSQVHLALGVVDRIGARLAEELVGAVRGGSRSLVEGVVAGPAVLDVVAQATDELVAAGAAVERVHRTQASQLVVAVVAGQGR